MRIYATDEDLTEWAGAPVDKAPRLLRAASVLVDECTMTAIYAVDDEGCPSDPIIRDAFRDATCAHATAWSALGVDPDAGVAGITSVSTPTGKSLGSASLNYSVTLVEAGVQAKVSTLFALTGQAASLIRGALPNARVRAVD